MQLVVPLLLQRLTILHWSLGALVVSEQLAYSPLHLFAQHNHAFLGAYDFHLYPIAFLYLAQQRVVEYLELLDSLHT